MNTNIIDTRGRSCPEPALMVKNEIINKPKYIEVLCDTKVSVDNISRLSIKYSYSLDVIEDKDTSEFTLKLSRL